jgi:hypothetical protein
MRTLPKLSALLAGLLLTLTSMSALAADAVGSVERVGVYAYGTVPTKSRQPIYLRDDVFFGERLETVDKGSLKVVFIDETQVFLGSKSNLVIDAYVYDPKAANESAILKMTVGNFRYVSGKLSKNVVKIDTPLAVLGIRGTDITVEIEESGKTVISVTSGEITVSPKDGSPAAVAGKGAPVGLSPGVAGVHSVAASSVSGDPGLADPGTGAGPGSDGGGGDGGGGGGSSCFAAGTEVLMADGSVKPIESVLIGEKLAGENGAVNEVLDYERPLLAGRRLYALNGGVFFVTSEHPFRTREGWKSIDPAATKKENPSMEVSALRVGDVLVTKDGDVTITSLDASEVNPSEQVFNFKLTGNKTYFVREKGRPSAPSAWGKKSAPFLLVHNCG